MKYNEFDNFINETGTNIMDQYWYDLEYIDEGMFILQEFTDEDWGMLRNQIVNKPVVWQMKTLTCFDSNEHGELDIVLSIINPNNNDLFTICVETMVSLIDDSNKLYLLQNSKVINMLLNGLKSNNEITSNFCMQCLNELDNFSNENSGNNKNI